jgi:type I restriction enzyme S subunit
MDNWRESTWGDEISLEYGKGIRDYANGTGVYRVFGSNGPVGWTTEALAPGPGVILGRKGAYRGVRFSPDPFFVIDTAYYVIAKSDLDMRWLYYAIIHHKLGEIDDGSPVPSTTRSAVYVRDLTVPPLSEQRAIATVLGSLDDKIDLNKRTNETLEAMARTIFKDWFVDFGPSRAKTVGMVPYLADNLWSLFPSSLDAEERPIGWQEVSLLDLCELKRGYDLPTSQRSPGPYPIISSSGESGFHSNFMADAPGVVTGRYGTLGQVYFVNQPYWPLNTTLYVCDFKGNSPLFVYYLLKEVDFLRYSDKAAVPGVNRNHLHQAKWFLAVSSESKYLELTRDEVDHRLQVV